MLESVGSGAMGVVWRAKDERLERVIAIKQLRSRPGLSAAQTDLARGRAMREARIAARLHHRNAIAMLDVAEHEGDPFLVMEFLASRSLSAVLAERGTLPAEQVAAVGVQVAAALAAAHTAGIVHRDVKPGNILLDDDGMVKITDFGISRAHDDGTATETGMVAGTPAYLAPEVARGREPSAASDVFSLGATLYHALEGAPPFGTNTNPLALLHAVASGNVPPPRYAGPFASTLMSLLRVDPADRPTMAEAAGALTLPTAPLPTFAERTVPAFDAQRTVRAFDVRRTVPAHPVAAPRVRPDQPKPRRGPLIAALLGVVLLAGVVTIVVGRPGTDPGTPGAATTTVTVSGQPSAPPSTPVPDTAKVTDYSAAGRQVISYFGSDTPPARRWAMLGPNGQAVFGDLAAFERHWAQYDYVSSRNANGVTANPDGSVNVPVDVTVKSAAGEVSAKKVVRVILRGGQYLIDSDSR
ncbi:protein kinase domain-containing protein [Actinokineospora sp.]|uniref:protein kinase domain-containing protein n=1 Tax=Actinokineospora sp. TaxID=1872133 RepID=UPI0040382A68